MWIINRVTLTVEIRNNLETYLTSVTLSSPKPTWTKLTMNPCFRGSRGATEGLSHGMAYSSVSQHFVLGGTERQDSTFSLLCMYVCVLVCMYVSMNMCMYVFMYERMYVYMYVCTGV